MAVDCLLPIPRPSKQDQRHDGRPQSGTVFDRPNESIAVRRNSAMIDQTTTPAGGALETEGIRSECFGHVCHPTDTLIKGRYALAWSPRGAAN